MQVHKKNQAIGVFDSGIGGLTVANAIIKRLPNEALIYFGDTAHLPYGDKSADAIRYYCLKIVKFLLEKQCKMIVIACNSASSAAYEVLLDFFQGQAIFVNVVDPLVEAVHRGQHQNIGIIATKATTRSGIYPDKLLQGRPDLSIQSLATPLLVPMIEEGYCNNTISEAIIQNYLSNPSFEKIDALLLACTHYPLIRRQIEAFFRSKVQVYDSNDVVAQTVYQQLKEHELLNDQNAPQHQFYISDYTKSFEETTRIFYREKISLQHCPIW